MAGRGEDDSKRRFSGVGCAALVVLSLIAPPMVALAVQGAVLDRGDCYASPNTTFTVIGDTVVLVVLCYLAAVVSVGLAFTRRPSRWPLWSRVVLVLGVATACVGAMGFVYADQRTGANALPCDRVDGGVANPKIGAVWVPLLPVCPIFGPERAATPEAKDDYRRLPELHG